MISRLCLFVAALLAFAVFSTAQTIINDPDVAIYNSQIGGTVLAISTIPLDSIPTGCSFQNLGVLFLSNNGSTCYGQYTVNTTDPTKLRLSDKVTCHISIQGATDMACFGGNNGDRCYFLKPNTGTIQGLSYDGTLLSGASLRAPFGAGILVAPTKIVGYFLTSFNGGHTLYVYDAATNTIWQFRDQALVFNLIGSFNATAPVVSMSLQTRYKNSARHALYISYQDDPNLYNLTRPEGGNFTQSVVLDPSPFGKVSLVSVDYLNRILVYDPTCSCIKQVDSNGTVIAQFDQGTYTPTAMSAQKGRIYTVNDLGVRKFSQRVKLLSATTTQNITCTGRGGAAKIVVEGGSGPFSVDITPDHIHEKNLNIISYGFIREYSGLDKLIRAPADMILYGSRINPAFELVGQNPSQVSIVTAAEMNGTVPYTGETCVRANWGGANIAFDRYLSFVCNSGNPKCLQVPKYDQLHMYVFTDKTQRFRINIGTTTIDSIDTATDPRVQSNKWSKLAFDLSPFNDLTSNQVQIFSNHVRNSAGEAPYFYIDDVHLSAFKDDVPHKFTVTDNCGETVSAEIHISDDAFAVEVDVTPVTCNARGLLNVEKSTDGILFANVSYGQAPFTYDWLLTDDNTTNTVANLPSLSNAITVYDNALNPSFKDLSIVSNGELVLNDAVHFFSPPYGLSFTSDLADTSITFVAPTALNITDWPAIEFMVNGGEYGGQRLYVVFSKVAKILHRVTLESIMPSGVIAHGVWQKVHYDIPKNFTTYDRISFVAYGDAQPTIFFDDIYIVGKDVLKVTDATGCPLIVSRATIPAPPAIQFSKGSQNLKCNNSPVGSLTVIASGGTSPISTSVSSAQVPLTGQYTSSLNGQFSTSIMTLPQSRILVNITDFVGCQAPSFYVDILQPPALSIELNVQPIQCLGGDARLTASVTGGVPPYTFSWFSDSALTPTLSPIPEMWYSDEASAALGVTSSGLVRVCDGTGLNTGVSAKSGYCVLAFNSSDVQLSCSSSDCLSTAKHSSLSFYMYVSAAADIEGMDISLTKAGLPLWSAPIKNLATFAIGEWTKVVYDFSSIASQLTVQPDGFSINASTITGTILLDDIVSIPKESVSTIGSGVSVYSGFNSIVTGPSNAFFVSVVDSNGCQVERRVDVEQPAAFQFTSTSTNSSSFESTDGSITVEVTGGTPTLGYVYEWTRTDDPTVLSTSNVLSNVAFGAFKLKVTDSNGCSGENTFVLYSDPVPSKVIVYRDFNKSLAGGMSAVVAVGFLVAIVTAILFIVNLTAFSALGTFFSSMILLGVITSYIGAIMVLPKPTDSLCMAYPWLMGIAFVFVYGCLFIKTWTIYRVWSKAKEYQKTHLTPIYIIRLIIGALVIEVVFLIIWTVVEPIEARWVDVQNGELQLQCTSDSDTFWIIFLAYKGAWLVLGAVLSILSRDVIKKFNESSSIAYAIYNNIVLLTIGIPLGVLLEDVAGGRLVIMVVIPVLAFTFTLCILFVPQILESVMPSDVVIQPKSSKGSAKTTTASGTNSGSGSGDTNSSGGHTPPISSKKTIELKVI